MKICDDRGCEFEILEGFPTAKNLASYRIKNSQAFHIIVNNKNTIIFQLIEMTRGIICISNYLFPLRMNLICTSPNPILEFFTTLYGKVSFHLQKDLLRTANEGTFNCIATPFVRNLVTIDGTIGTMDCHLDLDCFEELAIKYPELNLNLQAYKNGKRSALFPFAGELTFETFYLQVEFLRKVNEEDIGPDELNKEYLKIVDSMLCSKGTLFKNAKLSYIDICAFCHILTEIHDYPEVNYTLNQLYERGAKYTILNENKLGTAFKEIYGKTPMAYIKYYKIQKAMEYFQMGMSESEVAPKVGYTNLSHFERDFKKITNMTIKEYIQKLKNKKDPKDPKD